MADQGVDKSPCADGAPGPARVRHAHGFARPTRHPHWHVLLWAENETSLQNARHILRDSWLRDDGGAPCAAYRVLAFKLGWRDGLGEVDAYLTNSERASVWAAAWGVVLVTYFGMPDAEGAEA